MSKQNMFICFDVSPKKKNRNESQRYKSTYLSVPFQVFCVGSFTQLQLSVEWWLIHEETTFHRISEKKN